MSVLAKIKPERVFYYFEELCKIPHGSGNTDKISDYCVEFANRIGLVSVKDEHNNVIIKKPASKGYENHDTVIIQGHLDMVCEKEPDSPIDFTNDGLDIAVDGDFVYANGTTLGGDDGIAIAMAMAVLEDTSLCHPPIEALFTTDEETGMYGAEGLDVSNLDGKIFINIDSEVEGILTVSCAGGARAMVEIPLAKGTVNAPCYKITLDGLIGGHSGVEIDKGRLNSNVTMGKFLKSLPFDFTVCEIRGGLKDNAIPRSTEAIISCNDDIIPYAKEFVANNRINTDPDLTISVTDATSTECYDKNSSKAIVDFLCTVPNGIQSMSKDITGLVQTSLNLGILSSDNDKLTATFAVRSSVNSEKYDLLDKLSATAKKFGGTHSSQAHYPAWEYRKESRLRDTMVNIFTKLYGYEPKVEAIHAGLECGLFSDKIEGLDAVSFGPNLYDIHTTRERMSIESVQRSYNYLLEILKAL